MLHWRRTIENTTSTFIERAFRVLRKDHTAGSVREGMCVRSDTCRARFLRVAERNRKRNVNEASRRENDGVIPSYHFCRDAGEQTSRSHIGTWTYQFASATLVTSLKGTDRQTDTMGCQWR